MKFTILESKFVSFGNKKLAIPHILKKCPDFIKATQKFSLYHGRNMNQVREKESKEWGEIENFLDDYFFKKIGWQPYKSGVFSSGDKEQASKYGTVYEIYPVGNFKFLYFPDIYDLYQYVVSIIEDYESLPLNLYNFKKVFAGENKGNYFDIFNDYKTEQNSNLKNAILGENEIILNSDEYILVKS